MGHSLLLKQNLDLFQQSNENKIRNHTKSTVVGKAKIMTSEDIALAKRKREEKEAAREAKRRKKSASTSEMGHTLPHAEEKHLQEILRSMEAYCSILQF